MMRELLVEVKHVARMHRSALVIAVSCIMLWIATFHEAIVSAARVWWVSEIYTHGFFVIPLSGYLIWRKRNELTKLKSQPAFLALVPLFIAAIIYIVGTAGNISLFQHAAIFAILPLSIWLVFGTKISITILFPLAFILFSIPFGEEFIPYLQKITADMSVLMLRFIDIPVFRNGLYIEIPNGRFIVAEACSGVRFFVGAAVFGAIYAYISYTSRLKQFIYFGVSLIVPIIANSIRVSSIILIGYFSDMKYATGVDHIVYGWIFFAIVILLLIFIGNIWVDKSIEINNSEVLNENGIYTSKANILAPIGFVLLFYVILYLWSSVIESNKLKYKNIVQNTVADIQTVQDKYWQPKYEGASHVIYNLYKVSNNKYIDYFSAYYPYNTTKTEIISSANRIYDPDDWTLKSSSNVDIKLDSGENIHASLYYLIGKNQEYRLILYWYEIGSLLTSNRSIVKLYQSYVAIMSKPGSGRVVIYSMKYPEGDLPDAKNELINFIKNNHK